MRPNFSNQVKEAVLERCGWICEHCDERRVEDFHHMISNCKYNQKKYKLFLQSAKNCKGLCRQCHEDGKIVKSYRISDSEAAEFEREMNES